MPPMQPPMQPQGPMPAAMPAQDQFSGLQNLTREELVELDSLITPRLASLLVKAFPWAREALAPLLADDMEQAGGPSGGMMESQTPGGPMPRPTSPLGRVG